VFQTWSMQKIKEHLSQLNPEQLSDAVLSLSGDNRAGVRKLGEQLQRKVDKMHTELERLRGMAAYEIELAGVGNVLCGIDEAGRGPLAGPVVAGAAILPEGWLPEGLDDSKKLSEKNRNRLYDLIVEHAVAWGVGIVEPERIDTINILEATREAMKIAVSQLAIQPDCLVLDAIELRDMPIPQYPVIKGDSRCLSIAAASILAKVTRDRILCQYGVEDPRYGYEIHKGYGTALHYEALRKYGLSPLHRRSFLKEFG